MLEGIALEKYLVTELHAKYQAGYISLNELVRAASAVEGYPVMIRWGVNDVVDEAEKAGLGWSRAESERFLYRIEKSLQDSALTPGWDTIENLLPEPGSDKARNVEPAYW